LKIRKAVGAVVFQKDEYLLVHKVKSISDKSDITPQWDFPKGGIEEFDKDLEKAVLRELQEETGSSNFRIANKFDKKICFNFPIGHKYDRQETIMFYVEYLGNRDELKPQDDEIDEIRFVPKDDLMSIISLDETAEFLREALKLI
jgi:putative (di)nucleoside polyphosphate hydrolase